MAGLLARFFAPRIGELEARIQKLDQAAKFWEQRYSEELSRREQLEERLDAESVANREREDLLLSEALRGAGLQGVPTHQALKQPDAQKGNADDDNGLDDQTLKILEARAEEMATAKYGEAVTDEQIAEHLRLIKQNPEYYASN